MPRTATWATTMAKIGGGGGNWYVNEGRLGRPFAVSTQSQGRFAASDVHPGGAAPHGRRGDDYYEHLQVLSR